MPVPSLPAPVHQRPQSAIGVHRGNHRPGKGEKTRPIGEVAIKTGDDPVVRIGAQFTQRQHQIADNRRKRIQVG